MVKKIFFNRQLIVRQLFLIICDIFVFAASSFMALWLRLEGGLFGVLESDHAHNVLTVLPLSTLVAIIVYALFGLYNSLWRFAGERESLRIVAASFCVSVLHILLLFLFDLSIPRSFVFIQFFLLVFMMMILRFSYRFLRYEKKKKIARDNVSERPRRTMIIGAGDAGAMVLKELQQSALSHNRVVCIVDDDSKKQGNYLLGVPIAGGVEDIPALVKWYRVEEIIVAIPSVGAKDRSRILEICGQTNCRLRILPGIYQLVNGEIGVQHIRDVQIEDLLSRESVRLDNQEERRYYAGKTILVTGGGGSIGSELCRQIAACKPRQLIIFDIYENNAYDTQQELEYQYGGKLNLAVEIGSVRDRERVEAVFSQWRPEIVFHAAAHKHVPLMERSSCEAIKNNVFGTCNVADMAEKYGAEKFVLISTDKAVNPTNIMGASKRLCEMVVQCRTGGKTSFAAVRFGNVLGSNGSVIPLFKRQIAAGGPITITDKRIIRYFMTIAEASQLVMEAGAMAKNGELFVLDMGKPVRIYDLAVNMIKLSGMKPHDDIEIKEVGLRPGEKLYEELLIHTENLEKTKNDLIFIERDTPLARSEVAEKLQVLAEALEKAKSASAVPFIKEAIRRTVPSFHEPDEVNHRAEEAEEMKAALCR